MNANIHATALEFYSKSRYEQYQAHWGPTVWSNGHSRWNDFQWCETSSEQHYHVWNNRNGCIVLL